MKRDNNGRLRAGHFSWLEYIGTLLALGVFAALLGIMYGSGIPDIWNRYVGWYILYWAIITGVFCGLTAYQKYRKFDKPMRILGEATSRVAAGDFSVYIKTEHLADRHDYIDIMLDDFNKMVAELGSIETLKNDFVSNVSHEIKTPIAIIRNYTSALKKEDLPPETREEYMDTIIEAADRLTGLVTNILRLNKLDNQEILPEPEPYDLCRQLCDCALAFESLWERKNIEFSVDIEDRAMIKVDQSMLELVWNNLLSNALKFTEEGGRVTMTQTSDEHSVTVTVSDTGCGITEEALHRVFDRFYQGDTSHSKEGNGLGLALAYRVIDKLGGTMTVISEYGKGSAFTVRLNV